MGRNEIKKLKRALQVFIQTVWCFTNLVCLSIPATAKTSRISAKITVVKESAMLLKILLTFGFALHIGHRTIYMQSCPATM
jgi:hypothetical protein